MKESTRVLALLGEKSTPIPPLLLQRGSISGPSKDCTAEAGLLVSLADAGRAIEMQRDEALRALGLSVAKLGALRELVQAGEALALGELANRLTCVKSNVTQLVDRMEHDGLVRRVPDSKDRRCLRAVVTTLGKERYALGHDAERAVENRILGELEPEERDQLKKLVEKLAGPRVVS